MRNLFIEPLEQRRFLSVTASSVVVLTKGATWSTRTLQGTTIISTSTNKVIGKTTFNKIACTKVQSTITGTSGATSSNSYAGFDKAGNAVSFGSVITTSISGYTDTTTGTFSPAAIVLPATVTTKLSKAYSWTDTLTSLTNPGGITSTSTETLKYTFKLASAKQVSVKVPAGTFKAYIVNVTSSITVQGQTSTTTVQEWLAPGTGVVKAVSGKGSSAVTVELTKFKA